MNPTFACFVTGTDTEIGKTLISSALLHALAQQDMRAAGMKPIAAGAEWRGKNWYNEDVEALTAASTVKLRHELAVPYLLRTPAAPHIAARLDGITIEPAPIAESYRQIGLQANAVVVEGVGGFCVPLSDRYDTADMAVQFGLPIVLVVGLRLGCINHALLTAEAIAARGLKLAGWVANTVDTVMPYLADNVQTLQQRLPAPLLGVVPRLPQASAALAATYLDFSCLPGWPGRQTM